MVSNMANLRDLFEKAETAHKDDFDWRAGYNAYQSDFEWNNDKPEMWKLGYLYAHIHQTGGYIPQTKE